MKILIADDDRLSRMILEAALRKWGYEVVVTKDGQEAWEAIQKEEALNILILDWMMPVMDGVELCRRIREHHAKKYVYIILLTAKGDRNDIISGLESGADDYVVKPFDAQELKCRVRIGQRIIDLEEKLGHLASIDYLTNMLNRRSFMERLEAEFSRSNRQKTPVGIILADIDHFKLVNDRYGHQAGDAVLKEFSGCLNHACRIYDFIGRYGGEEFLVCCPGASGIQVISIAERMRKVVSSARIVVQDCSEPIHITASFGAAWKLKDEQIEYPINGSIDVNMLRSREKESIKALIGRADEAMYRAKAGGRNRVCPETI